MVWSIEAFAAAEARTAGTRKSHLQQHAGQDDGAGGGRLHVRVGQPGVERNMGTLMAKPRKKAQKTTAPSPRQVELHQIGDLKRVSAELAEGSK